MWIERTQQRLKSIRFDLHPRAICLDRLHAPFQLRRSDPELLVSKKSGSVVFPGRLHFPRDRELRRQPPLLLLGLIDLCANLGQLLFQGPWIE